jgi:hypothetical protein
MPIHSLYSQGSEHPLIDAASEGSLSLVEHLLQNGALVNQQYIDKSDPNKDQQTALIASVSSDKPQTLDIVKTLSSQEICSL